MNIKTLMSQAEEEGWHLREENIEDHLGGSCNNIQSLNKHLLNQDLKDIGLPSLSGELLKGKLNQLITPIILQVSNVRNISAPKANEESGAAPRLLKVTLTDGISYVHGIEVQPIKCLSLKTAPGTKIKLVSKVPVVSGFLLLSASNIQLLGGEVEDLYKKWQMSQSASKYSRSTTTTDGLGPPNWVPFGHKILVTKEKNFKALNSDQSSDKDDEFESQRKQVVQEISQGSSQKIFGGGKQMLDSNVQKVVNAGFSVQDAEWSLKRNKNDAYRAIQDLRGNSGGNSGDGTPKPQEEPARRGMQRGRGRGGRGRGKGGPDDSDEEDYVALSSSSRPSGPASLLDYLESKILDKKDPSNSSVNDYSYYPKPNPRGRDRGNFGRRGSKTDRGKPVSKNQSEAIMSENWPSLQKKAEPEPVRKREVSPNIYGRDYEEDEYNNYQEDRYRDNRLRNQSGIQVHESHHYPNSNYKENKTGYGRGNSAYNPKNFQDKNYENKGYTGKYDGRNYSQESAYNSKNFRDNNDENKGCAGKYDGRNYSQESAYNPKNFQDKNYENKGYTGKYDGRNYSQESAYNPKNFRDNNDENKGCTGKYDGRNYSQESHNYHDSHSTDNNSRYQSEYQGNASQNYQGKSYKDRKPVMHYSEDYQVKNQGRHYQETRQIPQYESNQQSNSYQQSYGYQPDKSPRYKKPDQPIFVSSRGRQQSYDRTQDYSSKTTNNSNTFQEWKQEEVRKEPTKEHSTRERELIAQFEKSMVMAGCYEPSESHSHSKSSYQSNNYNSEESRTPYNDGQSTEFYGSVEYHRGRGYGQRRGGRPRYGRGDQY